MKFERLAEGPGDDDGIFTTGSRPDEVTTNYSPTWGLKCHQIVQEITTNVEAHMKVYEAGALFITRFPHYLAYQAEEVDMMVYMVSVDMETEA